MNADDWRTMRQSMDTRRAFARVQDEARVATLILQQHPDLSRDQALRWAARIVERAERRRG